MKALRKKTQVLACLAAVGMLSLAGCSNPEEALSDGSDAASQERPTAEFNQEAADLLPSGVKEKGTLEVATTMGMAPLGYPDEKTGDVVGLNTDIMEELGEVLGLKVTMKAASMDQIIPGIQAGRYDATAANMAITDDRIKVLDFVQYYFADSSLALPKGNPENISADSMCGKAVGLEVGSFQQTEVMPGKSKECKKAGNEPIDVQGYPDQQKALSALDSGRVDTVAGDTPILLYAANLNDKIEVGDALTDGSILGIGVEKKSPLTKALAAAMNDLIETGVYEKTMEMYGIEDLAIDHAEIKK
ncbi:MAG: transporter substrate-binding domain-containing protein [Ancrocorticia sp.]|uniref:transporter substrate-binding domain-containing protein n=1 Tax=Ancrocorticia sp. TaxID=2593684 RepID=UPI003F8E8BD5